MKIVDIRDRLRKNLAIAMRVHADNLSSGRAGDFPQYQRIVGNIKGLRDAIDIVEQTFDKILNEGDSDE